MNNESLAPMVEYIAKAIANNPDEVSVEEEVNEDGIVQANEIYNISEKMESYLVNYPQVGDPVAVQGIKISDTLRVKYLTGEIKNPVK